MMRLLFLLVVSAFAFDPAHLLKQLHQKSPQDAGGGVPCIACTIGLSLIEQLALIKNQTVEIILQDFCSLFPSSFEASCDYYVENYGKQIIFLFELGLSPDGVCHGIDFCTDPTCRLWPARAWERKAIPNLKIDHLNFNPWQWLEDLINLLAKKHEPIVDLDGDLFSIEPELRGSSWRGRDCNDFDKSIYPGRKVNNYGIQTDHNCNGIKGLNGIDYETKFCAGSGQIGTMVIGDSAGAHFHIPGDWMNASAITSGTYSNLLFAASNELDWPQLSSWTGYVPSTKETPMDSMYSRLRERNLCNHRDYQNIAVNGMRSGAVSDLVSSIARNQTNDLPVFVLLELIGNDVCSPHHTVDTFTSVPDFTKNIIQTLNYLDTILPKGSHVLFMELAQGSILWDAMHAKNHPIGATYAEVYGYLNCMEANPCWAWLNSNATVRQLGDQHAQLLSGVYPQIIKNYTFKNFDMDITPFPLAAIVEIWKKTGGEVWQLIEPIDGFHPNQIANSLIGEFLFNDLLKRRPDWIGKVNPNNQQIISIFGDQNGH